MLGRRTAQENKETPPSKRKKTDTLSQELKKARAAGLSAARRGCNCPTRDALMKRNGYTEEQAIIYLEAFNEKATSPGEQAIKKAQHAAQEASRSGCERPSREALMKRNYTEAQAAAYLEAFDKKTIDTDKQAIKRAQTAGQSAAHKGCDCPSRGALMKRNYTEAQAIAYLKAFNEKAATMSPDEPAIQKAKNAGRIAASNGYDCPKLKALMARNYSKAQAQAYLKAFEEKEATMPPDERSMKRAQHAGQMAARRGNKLPNLKRLMKRYNKAQAEAYIEAYNEYKKNHSNDVSMNNNNEISPTFLSHEDDLNNARTNSDATSSAQSDSSRTRELVNIFNMPDSQSYLSQDEVNEITGKNNQLLFLGDCQVLAHETTKNSENEEANNTSSLFDALVFAATKDLANEDKNDIASPFDSLKTSEIYNKPK